MEQANKKGYWITTLIGGAIGVVAASLLVSPSNFEFFICLTLILFLVGCSVGSVGGLLFYSRKEFTHIGGIVTPLAVILFVTLLTFFIDSFVVGGKGSGVSLFLLLLESVVFPVVILLVWIFKKINTND